MIDALNTQISRLQADTAAGNTLAARTRSTDSEEALRAVATEFEALFVKQMLSSMRGTLNPENDLLHGGLSQDIFEDMLYDEYSKVMAKAGSIGIADLIVQQLK